MTRLLNNGKETGYENKKHTHIIHDFCNLYGSGHLGILQSRHQ